MGDARICPERSAARLPAGVATGSPAGRWGAALVLLTLASGCAPEDRRSVPAEGRQDVSVLLGGGDTTGYERAVEPRPFEFPADHGPHPGFRTEWWYLTGNLETAPDDSAGRDPGGSVGSDGTDDTGGSGSAETGRRFGYQFTVFRVALAPEVPDGVSDWRTNQAYMAHFAVTDMAGGRFLGEERFARGALGLAGARAAPFRVWLEDWSLTEVADGGTEAGRDGRRETEEGTGDRRESVGDDPAFPARFVAGTESVSVDLLLERGKGVVPQGREGLSVKGPGAGNASHYFSLTRMPTEGWVVLGDDTLRVRGASWMDREWSTSALGPRVEGWDWFALQLEDGRELMYYRLRTEDGTASPLSAGTWVEPDGSHRDVEPSDVELIPLTWWESPEDGDAVRYPVSWEIALPSEDLSVTVSPVLRDQEWRGAFRYWEGAVDVEGSLKGESIRGRGYVELTGYDGSVPGSVR